MDKTETSPDKPEFDPVTAAELQATASMKLLALLKAKQEANNASSTKEFAVRCVRGLEATIHQLFDVGANTQEVLSQLMEALPSIPVDDLRYALKTLRIRNRKLRVSSQPAALSADAGSADKRITQSSSEVAKETKPKLQPRATTPATPNMTETKLDLPAWADGSDRQPGESDDDYRLRKEIEGPPEARQKFIGEH